MKNLQFGRILKSGFDGGDMFTLLSHCFTQNFLKFCNYLIYNKFWTYNVRFLNF